MPLTFDKIPPELAERYRQRGYWIGQPLTRAIEAQARQRPDAVAVIDGPDRLTYGQIDAMAAAMAGRLAARGFGPGDTALVQLPNCAAFVVVFHALLKAGIAPVNAIFSHRRLEMTAYASQLRPRLLIGDAGHELFADGEPPLAEAELTLRRGATDHTALEPWFQPGPTAAFRPTEPDEIAFFQLSGGSTGTPKLIPRTHDDYDYSVRASAEICGFSQDTVFLCALPAAHNFTLSSPGVLGTFHAGGRVVMAPNPEPERCFGLIAAHGVTVTALVPSAVHLWLAHAARHGAPAPLAHLLVGGASFDAATARRVGPDLGCRLQQVFGMAEGLVNYTRLDDDDETVATTQGRPISPDDEVRVLDDAGHPVPDGTPGALAVRGPYTLRGYYGDAGRDAFDAEGFYHSGDVVVRRADGTLRVVGRIKDQINRGGEKIAAEEIEALLLRHPAIAAAALVAAPDALTGERSVAFVVAREPVRPSALRRHLDALGVASYKLPDRFRLIDALPLTPVGKTDKRRLRDLLATEEKAPA